jgi:hypothetical protein
MAFRIDDINVVVDREMLQSIKDDFFGASAFHDWRFSGFQISPDSTTVRGAIWAKRNLDGVMFHAPVAVSIQTFEVESPTKLFSLLDVVIVDAVKKILTAPVPHVDGVLCENVCCERCYR